MLFNNVFFIMLMAGGGGGGDNECFGYDDTDRSLKPLIPCNLFFVLLFSGFFFMGGSSPSPGCYLGCLNLEFEGSISCSADCGAANVQCQRAGPQDRAPPDARETSRGRRMEGGAIKSSRNASLN